MTDKINIIPVILGSDANAYNIARTFHEEYGVNSITVGKGVLAPVKDSIIIESYNLNNFDDDNKFINFMKKLKEENSSSKMILFAAGENYVNKIFRNYNELKGDYIIPYTNPEQGKILSEKENVYELFEKYGIDYPKYILTESKYSKMDEIPFDFPVVLKPTQSTQYFELDFKGKEKAYIIKDIKELNKKLKLVYKAGYNYPMFIQEFVFGDISDEYVLNAYTDSKGNTTFMSLGKIVVDDPNPDMRGNYLGIENSEDSKEKQEIFERVKKFLNSIEYTGLSNFDFKKDTKTGKYMCFEMNLRQGRSSYCSKLSSDGNFAKVIVNDFILDKVEYFTDNKEYLWYYTDYETLKIIIDKKIPEEAERIDSITNKNGTMEYDYDNSPERKALIEKFFANYKKSVKKFI